jgi:hypothetical protein
MPACRYNTRRFIRLLILRHIWINASFSPVLARGGFAVVSLLSYNLSTLNHFLIVLGFLDNTQFSAFYYYG